MIALLVVSICDIIRRNDEVNVVKIVIKLHPIIDDPN